MNLATGDIRAVEFTSSRQGDSPVLRDLPAQTPPDEPNSTVTADGAYDTRLQLGRLLSVAPRQSFRSAATVAPGRKTVSQPRPERNGAGFGRPCWKRLTRYCAPSRLEGQMRRFKSLGDRHMARDPDRQTAEFHTGIAFMNRFSALGRAKIVRVA